MKHLAHASSFVLAFALCCFAVSAQSDQVAKTELSLPIEVELTNRIIKITRVGIEQRLVEKLNSKPEHPFPGLVLLYRIPSSADRHLLAESGVRLSQFLGNNTYLAKFANSNLTVNLPNIVVWAGMLHPEDKVEKALWQRRYESWSITETGNIRVLITFDEAASGSNIETILEENTDNFSAFDGYLVWRAEVSAANISKIASSDLVTWIEQGPHPDMPLDMAD